MRLHRSKVAVLAAALAGAAGCGGARTAQRDGHVTVCEERAVTGSEINRVRCRRKHDADERARRDRAFLQRLQNESPRPAVGPSGQ